MTPEQPRPASRVGFTPLRPITPGLRVVLWVCGPLLWLVALVIVAEVVREGQAIGVGLAVLAISLLISALWLSIARRRALRESRELPPCA